MPTGGDWTASGAPTTEPVDRCKSWIDKEVLGMSWYIGEYGLLDYVDVEKMPAVLRAQCDTLTDTELACVAKEQSVATECLPQSKLAALRTAVLPLLSCRPSCALRRELRSAVSTRLR